MTYYKNGKKLKSITKNNCQKGGLKFHINKINEKCSL